MELDELIDEFRMGRVREIATEDRPPVILLEHRDDRGIISNAERRVAEGERFCALKVDRRRGYLVHEFELEDLALARYRLVEILAGEEEQALLDTGGLEKLLRENPGEPR